MSERKPKRFWKQAGVEQVGDRFGVRLDGRTVKTPAKAELALPTRELAELIAGEWQAQDDIINPATMPMTRLANSAIDKVATQHREVADMLADYGDADLLCYRANFPVELANRQAEKWDPLLAWTREQFGAILVPKAGVMHEPQDNDSLTLLRKQVHGLDEFELSGFHDLVSLSGSLIIGFAAIHSFKPVEDLWDISRVDEIWQEEQWGKDDEAAELALAKRTDFLNASLFFSAAKTG